MEGAMLPSYGVVEGEDDMVRVICRENLTVGLLNPSLTVPMQ